MIILMEIKKMLNDQIAEMAAALISSRQSFLPKKLFQPGPNQEQLETIFSMAATAPDHNLTRPWRFVICPLECRGLLADAFAKSLLERDPGATDQQVQDAMVKAHRAPLVMLAIVNARGTDSEVPPSERIISAGCAMQNIFLMANALGFGASPTSGKSMYMKPVRDLFGLQDYEDPLCFINIGTPDRSTPLKPRMISSEFVSTLEF
jgi:nitroreductase